MFSISLVYYEANNLVSLLYFPTRRARRWKFFWAAFQRASDSRETGGAFFSRRRCRHGLAPSPCTNVPARRSSNASNVTLHAKHFRRARITFTIISTLLVRW